MPLAAVLGGLPATAFPYTLLMGNLDVIGITPIDSIRIDEVGPGGVSSIEFTYGDSTGTVLPQTGDVIKMQWNTPDVPIFLGWVDTWSSTPDFGGQGRSVTVQGIGIEAQLDWLIIPELP